MKVIRAQVCSSFCQTDGAERAVVYGVQVYFESGETVFCPDVNANKSVVERLCSLLRGSDLDTASLWEIFSDFSVITD